jgi:stage II sporulation protein D
VPRVSRAQSDADPASSSHAQALRVLLGRGAANTLSPQRFSFNGRTFRGSYLRDDDGQIVNLVDLEEYLYSVVSREMPPAWPPDALQAQAVCARTYVLQRSDPRRSYDLVPSELDQRYDGLAGETATAIAAVDATAGMVMSFAGRFAQIAYSSCCGGHTESSADAWGNVAISYLGGVVCTWCIGSPNYRWNRSLAFDAIALALADSLPRQGRLQDLRVGSLDPSGRARAFELATDHGETIVSGSAFRRAVGTRVLPSLLVTNVLRSRDGAEAQLDGGGLGHGVGLCQWGARGMALAARSAAEILGWYFPGTDLRNLK